MEYEKQFYNHTDKSNCNRDHLSETSEVILGSTNWHVKAKGNLSSYHSKLSQ